MYQLVGSRCNNKGLCWKDKDNEFFENPSLNQIDPKKHKKCVFDSPWKSIRLNLMFDWQGNFTSIYYKVCLRKRRSCFSKNGILLINMFHWTSVLVQMQNGWWILDVCMQIQWCFMH
jgi:hypothetical protein